MKNILLLLLVALSILWSCNQKSVTISEPTNEELIKILPEGNKISSDLLKSLKAELKSAISEGGFEHAIEVCNLKAIPISEKIKKASNKNIKIKRTTFKYRNPQNAPNEIERLALLHFQNLLSGNESLPDHYVQKVTSQDGVHYYYFKPLIVGNVCLGCHGNPENIDTKLLNQISQLYPEDKAMGYKEGDFRGLISVIIPE
ncbi:MAG: DUF3365 domain-containing protein [Bacteroidales bacterium]|nr:DUF3365 domain-containing protein [Bacteroidales bacterium]